MVKLGFVKEAEQCPIEYPRVFVRPAEGIAPVGFSTTVQSWPVRNQGQRFELAVDIPPGVDRLNAWIPPLATTLTNMGWSTWWIDAFALSMVMDRYITEALRLWGLPFFQHYNADAVVLVQVGLQRDAVMQAVGLWQEKHKHLEISDEHDFDKLDKEQAAQGKQRSGSFMSMLRPKFLSGKERTEY